MGHTRLTLLGLRRMVLENLPASVMQLTKLTVKGEEYEFSLAETLPFTSLANFQRRAIRRADDISDSEEDG